MRKGGSGRLLAVSPQAYSEAPRSSGDDLERIVEAIGAEIEKITSETGEKARMAGRVRAEIEASGLREGDDAKAASSADGERGLALVTEEGIRATSEGHLQQLGARSRMRLADIQRRVDEHLRVSEHQVSMGDQDLEMAKRSVEATKAAVAGQSDLPDVRKSQRIESDYLASREHYESVLLRRREAVEAKQALTARAAAAATLRSELPGLISDSANDLGDSIEGAFKQGYMERLIELRNEEMNPSSEPAAPKRPWYRRHPVWATAAVLLSLTLSAGGGFLVSDLNGNESNASAKANAPVSNIPTSTGAHAR